MNNKIAFILARLTIYPLLAAISYYLFRLQASATMAQSDLPQHLSIIDSYISGSFYIPHPVFHISVYCVSQIFGISTTQAAPIVMTLSVIATLFVVERILRFVDQAKEPRLSDLTVALLLLFVVAIYIPFFNRFIYLGQFSPNIWHSQTMLMLRPAALIAFVCYVKFLLIDKEFSPPGFVTGSFFLLASTAIKPSFAITFIPALIVFQLIFHAKDSLKWIKSAIWIAPSIMLLVYQFIQTYFYVRTGSYFHDKIILTNFGVLRIYSPNLFISALLVLAFPLVTLLTGWQRCLRNRYLSLSWLVTIVAYLQVAFLAEQQKFGQGAFAFGYVNALFLLYIFSMHEIMTRLRSESSFFAKPANLAPLAIFSLHLVSGIFYFAKLLQGGSYL